MRVNGLISFIFHYFLKSPEVLQMKEVVRIYAVWGISSAPSLLVLSHSSLPASALIATLTLALQPHEISITFSLE